MEARLVGLHKANPQATTTKFLETYRDRWREAAGAKADKEQEEADKAEEGGKALGDGRPVKHPLIQAALDELTGRDTGEGVTQWQPAAFLPYEATLLELLNAKTDCRLQMIRIAEEVSECVALSGRPP